MRQFVWCVAAACGCGVSLAQVVRVEYWAGGPMPVHTQDFAPGATIGGLPAFPPGLSRINVYSVGGSANIGTITFSSTPSEVGALEIDLVLGQGEPVEFGPMPSAGLNFAGLNPPSSLVHRLRLSGAVSGDVTGRIACGRVARFHVGGALGGEVIALGAGEAVGSIRAGRIAAVSDAIPGRLPPPLGIHATVGAIGSVATNGPITIPAPGSISAQRGIGEVTGTSVRARIAANAFGGNGNLGHVGCLAGDYEGAITAHHLGNPEEGMAGNSIYVTGAIRGTIHLSGNLYGGVTAEAADPVTGESIGAVKIDGNHLGLIDGLGDIGLIEILGDVVNDTNSFVVAGVRSRVGTILNVQVNGSVFGEPGIQPTFQAAHVNTLRIGGNANSMIFGWPFGPVEVKHLFIGGSLEGEATLSRFLTCRIGVDVSPGAILHITSPIAEGRAISIGRSLQGVILMDAPAGLNGQVVLNANLDPAGGWAGSGVVGLRRAAGPVVFMGQTVYQRSGADFGSGAIGVAPYALRARECAPNLNVTSPEVSRELWPDGTERETMRIVLDGPVIGEGEEPVVVRRAPYSTTCVPPQPCLPVFEDESKLFVAMVAPPGLPREIWVAPLDAEEGGPGTFGGGWLYRISPRRENGRMMVRASGTNLFFPPEVGDFMYTVAVDAFDLNRDGKTDTGDIYRWFKLPVDFNDDGHTDGADLLVLERAVDLHRE